MIPKKEFRIKGGEKILNLIRHFSPTERVVFGFLTLIAVISSMVLAWEAHQLFVVPIPAYGGSFTEGVIGLPRSINPILAITDVDRDLSTLIYSGLMKYDHGKLVGDLAEKYSISEDGLVYSFTLKDNIRFHDGTPLTTDDIEFTIQKVEDNTLKSPRRADWGNISVKKIDEKNIQFILKQPYSPFLSNTTLGIIPKHIWKNVSSEQFIYSQFNIEPIGSGPYQIEKISRDNGGIPLSYELSPFSRYYDGKAYISHITIQFYPNEMAALDAYSSGAIQSIAGISPEEAEKISDDQDVSVLHSPLPRIFGVFFNQNQAPVLANKEVRQALNMVVDKDTLVSEVLYGYGVRIDGPLPAENSSRDNKKTLDIDGAKTLLTKAGWTINKDGILEKKDKKGTQVLSFEIATADSPDLKKTAEILEKQWELLGADVTVKVFEYGDLSQNIIKTRKYDALLFGEFIGKDLDLYAFWHSSQRLAPGLNIAMYVNSSADKLLEEARTTGSEKVKAEKYKAFEKLVTEDVPAIFLYSPEYMYVIPKKIQGIHFGPITIPSDRWYDTNSWYISTENVWKIFTPNQEN